MTREEIVRSFQYNMTNAFIEDWYKKNHERYTEEIEDVFYEGAEAAQKYLVEKACKWLGKHINKTTSIDADGYWGDDYLEVNNYDDEDMFLSAFRKAMEE